MVTPEDILVAWELLKTWIELFKGKNLNKNFSPSLNNL